MKSRRLSCLWVLAAAAGFVYSQPTITSVLDPYTGGTKLCPGGQAVITGTGLGVGPVVTVGGVSAFTLIPPQSGPTMTIEIPVNAPVGTNVQVIAGSGANASAPFNITLTQYAPILISATSGPLTSPRHASTGVAVTPTTPAAPGEVIMFYAIGLGPTNPAVATGALGPSTGTRASPTGALMLMLGTTSQTPLASLASGQAFFGASTSGPESGSTLASIGIFQVTDTVPSGTAAGTYPVSLSVGGVTSNSVSLSVGTAPTGPVITAVVSPIGKTMLCPGDQAILSGLNLGTSPTVMVGTKAAYTISPPNNGNQMTIQIPVDAPVGAANIVVTLGTGASSAPFPITLTQYAPAIPVNGSASPPYHVTSQLPVTSTSPAVPGEQVVVIAFGLGATNPVVPTGTTAPSNPSPPTVTTPTVNLGATVINTGITAAAGSGQIGSYFVVFTVPPNQAAGNYGVSVSIGGLTSNLTTLTVFDGPVITNVTNAASQITAGLPNAGIAQGSIFNLYGSNLGPAALSIAPSAFQNATLSGTSVSVTVNGTTVAPLMYFTSATQIAALLPSNTPVGTGTITVSYNGQPGLAAPITVVANNLGIFTVTSDGQGSGIVTNADYSLVSVTPGTPCGGPYTTCGSANPGDTLILWATGLGPVSGSDAAGAGLGVAMPNIPLTLWLGGVQANVTYQGRSGCCIGEDQIVFVVPANVPTGCAVPLAVQIGNQISNYTLMAVAPKGSRTCTASNSTFTSSLVQALTTGTGTLNYGQIQLQRQPNSDNQPGLAGNTDYGSAQFLNVSVPAAVQPWIVSYLDDLPAGTCMVSNNVNGFNGGNYINLVKTLDGGPGIKVSGPNGSQTIAANGGQVTLGPGTFLASGAYTLTGTGGADIGSFSAAYTIPTPPTLTSPASGNGNNTIVTRANGITFTWTGGAANSTIQIQGGNSIDNTGANGVSFICYAAASAGTFTIPAAVLLTVPPGDFVNSEWNFVAYAPYGSFSASGLNGSSIQASYGTAIFTTLQ